MHARNITHTIDLWLGLISDPVVFILGITGYIYVFANDIREAVNNKIFFVNLQESPKLSVIGLLILLGKKKKNKSPNKINSNHPYNSEKTVSS